jgi:hypothetical protein
MSSSRHHINPVDRPSTLAVAHNTQTMSFARIWVSLLAGAGAGL